MLQLLGILGGLTLVIGSAWPSGHESRHPLHSVKNWLLFLGAVILFCFALIDYLQGTGTLLFALLEGLAILASILMMTRVSDTVNVITLSVATIALIILSIIWNTSLDTLWFIFGIFGVGIGYVLTPGIRRDLSFFLGSTLLVYFSYLGDNWTFFWFNGFFALFSAWYVLKGMQEHLNK